MFVCEACHPPACGSGDFHPDSRGACEVCGKAAYCMDCHYHAPAQTPRPAPEPLAETLRRLHREATRMVTDGESLSDAIDRSRGAAHRAAKLLPALADIVEVLEVEDAAKPNHPRHACPLCRALAALREQMGRK